MTSEELLRKPAVFLAAAAVAACGLAFVATAAGVATVDRALQAPVSVAHTDAVQTNAVQTSVTDAP